MEEQKKNNKVFIILTSIIFLLIGIIVGLILPEKELNDNGINNNQEQKNNIINLNTEITNPEVKEIYEIIKNNEWYPNYLETNLNEITNEILLSMVARSMNKDTQITESMYNDIKSTNGDGYALFFQGSDYLDESSDLVFSKTNQIFNKNITKEDIKNTISDQNYTCTSYVYNENLDKFLKFDHCGGGMATPIETVYNYQENGEEIIIYTVLAMSTHDDEADNWVYIDHSGKKYDMNTFKFTEDNMSNFDHLKYILKKDENNKFYIFNIEKIND